MANKVKPRICRTNEISIPIDTEECVLWLNPVQSVDDIKNPTRDFAWITPDNTVYVYNGHKIVPIFSANDSHIKWGHIDGDIKDQIDLYNILLKSVNGVKQNGTELTKDLEQKVNVSVPIMRIKVNNTELEPNDYTVNIDLTTYAKTSDIPTKLSQLSNDTGYVTPETIDVPIQTITVNGNLLTPDEHKNVSIEIPTKVSQLSNDSGYAKTSDIPTKTSQLTNDSGYITNAQKIYKGATEDGYENTGWSDGDLYVQYVENEESTDFSNTAIKTGGKWIDGKPIYKITKKWIANNKTVIAPLEVSHGISNIDTIVNCNAFYTSDDLKTEVMNLSGSYIGIPGFALTTDSNMLTETFLTVNKTSWSILAKQYANLVQFTPKIYVTIYYTLTTD